MKMLHNAFKRLPHFWVVVGAFAGACTGEVGAPRSSLPDNAVPAVNGNTAVTPPGVGPTAFPKPVGAQAITALWKEAPLSRITRVQVRNIAADVLGARSDITSDLPDIAPDDLSADGTLLVDSFYSVAQRLTRESLQTGTLKGRCTQATDISACATTVIHEMGPLLWRRPLDVAEESDLVAKVVTPAAALGGDEAVVAAVTALMVSPTFVYRVEEPAAVPGPGAKLPPHVVAARLAFLAWNSAPDKALLDAAVAGKLSTPAQRTAFVTAQLRTEKGARALADAHRAWLKVESLTSAAKDPTSVPGFTSDVAGDALAQLDQFTAQAYASGPGGFGRLWQAETMWTPASLRVLYGLPPSSMTGEAQMPAGQRSGILTQIAVMAASSKSTGVNAVTRGLYIYEHLLCQARPTPPPNVPPAPAKEQGGRTVSDRERYATHRSNPVCAGCHDRIDGLGLALEQYDAIGRFKDKDGEFSLSGDGWASGLDGTDPKFQGAHGLGALLAGSATARSCYSRRMVEWARGYQLASLDVDLATRGAAVPDSGDLSAVVAAIAADPNFDRRDFVQE